MTLLYLRSFRLQVWVSRIKNSSSRQTDTCLDCLCISLFLTNPADRLGGQFGALLLLLLLDLCEFRVRCCCCCRLKRPTGRRRYSTRTTRNCCCCCCRRRQQRWWCKKTFFIPCQGVAFWQRVDGGRKKEKPSIVCVVLQLLPTLVRTRFLCCCSLPSVHARALCP